MVLQDKKYSLWNYPKRYIPNSRSLSFPYSTTKPWCESNDCPPTSTKRAAQNKCSFLSGWIYQKMILINDVNKYKRDSRPRDSGLIKSSINVSSIGSRPKSSRTTPYLFIVFGLMIFNFTVPTHFSKFSTCQILDDSFWWNMWTKITE